MRLFAKLFGRSKEEMHNKKKIGTVEKTAELLDEHIYWNLISRSLQNTTNQSDQEAYLIRELEKLTPTEMIGFRLRTDKFLYDTYNSKMWCAAYIMNGGCSDDMFEYFRSWIISRGKDVFYQAKENPDSLISQKNQGEDGMFEFETFWYVALEAFQNQTGKNLYDFIDHDKFTTCEGNYPPFEFDWNEEDPASMKKLCPQLFEHSWEE